MASVSGGRSAVAGYDDPWWASLLVGRSFSRGIWGLTASVGLSDAAPDVTVGLVWRARLKRANVRHPAAAAGGRVALRELKHAGRCS